MREPYLGHLVEHPRRALAAPVVEIAVPVRHGGVRLTLTEKEKAMAQPVTRYGGGVEVRPVAGSFVREPAAR